jgi:putative GTP pyrophosphokinase
MRRDAPAANRTWCSPENLEGVAMSSDMNGNTPPSDSSEGWLVSLEAEYNSVCLVAESLRRELAQQISALALTQGAVLALPVESRIKSWSSIVPKLLRVLPMPKSVLDIHDLVGLRLVTLFMRDASRLVSLIARTFKVIEQEDTAIRLEDNKFGYASVHILIRLPEEWLKVPSMANLGNLVAEVQVRTLSQHLWAAASHVLQYKKEENVPSPVKRSINRVAALLETIDLEFDRVLAERDTYQRAVRAKNELDVTSLETALDSLLPLQNKTRSEYEYYSSLLIDLWTFNIRDARTLTAVIEKHREAILRRDLETARKYPEVRGNEFYFTHSGLVRGILELELGPIWTSKFSK